MQYCVNFAIIKISYSNTILLLHINISCLYEHNPFISHERNPFILLCVSTDIQELMVGMLKPADTAIQMAFFDKLLHLQAGSSSTVQWLELSVRVKLSYSAGGMLMLETVAQPMSQPASERMEEVGSCILDLLRTDMKSCRLLGPLFVKCLQQLVSTLTHQSSGLTYSEDASVVGKVNSSTSSALLELENNGTGPMASLSDAMALYTAAAICENMGNDLVEQVDRFSLLDAISSIISCHASISSLQADVKVLPSYTMRVGPETLTGGTLTLSIALGLMSALLAGNKPVSKAYLHCLLTFLVW